MKFIFTAKDDSVSANFFPIGKIILFIGIILTILAVIFPRNLEKQTLILSSFSQNPVMASYLQAFHANAPQNVPLYLQLLQQDAALGRVSKVRSAVIAYKSTHPPLDQQTELQFRWVEYLLFRFKAYQSSKPTTQKRIMYLKRLRDMANALADQPLPVNQLKILAHDSVGLGLPTLALHIYENLLQQHQLVTGEDYAEAGLLAMQNNKPLESANFYWHAYDVSRKLPLRRRYAFNALAALWSGDSVQQSLAAARSLPAIITNGQEQKIYLAKLALAANRPGLALDYVLQGLAPHVRTVRQFFTALDAGKIPYQDEAFTMAYRVFIYNNRIVEGYRIAQYAVQHQANSVNWRQKLAESATWMGDYNVAMREWLWVVQHTEDKKIMLKAMKTTQALAYDQVLALMLTTYLEVYPTDNWAVIQLAQTQNRLGQPDQALKNLSAIKPTPASMKLQAFILADQGDWKQALKTWETLDRKFGFSVDASLNEANILMLQGNFEQALQRLKLAANKATASQHEFWSTLAELAWRVHDDKWARLAFSQDLTKPDHLLRLISLDRVDYPEQALQYAVQGWFNFRHMWFFADTLYSADQLQHWPIIVKTLLSLTPRELQVAESKPIFWQAQASIYRATGDQQGEKALLIHGLERHPQMDSLKIMLLWLSIEQGNVRWIKFLLQDAYAHAEMIHGQGWHAYAAGLEALNRSSRALYIYLSQNLLGQSGALVATQPMDLQVWIDLAGTFDKLHYHETAYAIRYRLWQGLSQRTTPGSFSLQDRARALCQLIPYFASGTTQVAWVRMLLQDNLTAQEFNIILHDMVRRNAYELIQYFRDYYPYPLPDNIALFLALIQNDLPTIQDILTHTERVLPRAERIAAAERLENTAMVTQYAFEELSERPLSTDVYNSFTQAGIKEANSVKATQEYELFINLVGPRTKLETQLRLSNRWKLHPYFSNWDVKTNNPQVLTNVPSIDLQTGMSLEQKIWHGSVHYKLGYRKALNSFVPADLEINFQPSGQLNVDLDIGYNQENFQTTYLLMGGVQDQLNARFIYTPLKYDALQTEAQLLNYYSQDRHYLADGYNLHALYTHKIWLTYPDYTLGVYGNLFYFNRNGSYGGDVTTLFPPLTPEQQATPALTATTQEQNYKQIIPPTYGEGGVQFSFGDGIQAYSHAWRPYFFGALYYNSLTRLSHNVKGGIQGSVFGRDSLMAYAEYGNAPALASAVVYRFGLSYMLYW